MKPTNSGRTFLLVQIAAACVFAGRAWQHLFWDAPYRELLWDDVLMKPFIEKITPWTWHEFVTNLAVDEAIQQWMTGLGIFYALCAVLSLVIHRLPKFFRFFIGLGAAGLVFLALLYMKEHFFHLGQFFEFTLQFGSPIFLLLLSGKTVPLPKLVVWMKVAIALTFTCHGLYAIGYYPRPAIYFEMTMNILNISQAATTTFLLTAGFLDFIVAIGIFLPWKWAKWFLLYATFWGLATSLARIAGNFYTELPWLSLHEWVHQAVFRFPHFLIPLSVYFAIKNSTAEVRSAPL